MTPKQVLMYHVHDRDLDQSSVSRDTHWYQYGYANEQSSGVIGVVTKDDLVISQEYQLLETTERFNMHE